MGRQGLCFTRHRTKHGRQNTDGRLVAVVAEAATVFVATGVARVVVVVVVSGRSRGPIAVAVAEAVEAAIGLRSW